MIKIIVLGAGAIGSTFAALLSKKHQTTLIGRKGHVNKINKRGLRLTDKINETFHINSATKINNIDEGTIILLTVKAHETKQAVISIKDKIKKDTVIICIQNGLGSEEIVKSLVTCKVIRLVTMIGAIFLEDGLVEVTTSAPTYIPADEKRIAQLFHSTGIPIVKTSNIKQEIWNKLAINCVINGLGSVLRVKNNALQSAYLKDTKTEILNECITVAEKEGVTLKPSLLTDINSFIQISTNINSTLQDLMRHKKTEIDFLNGAITLLGKKYKIKTPVNTAIWGIIKASEAFRFQPALPIQSNG